MKSELTNDRFNYYSLFTIYHSLFYIFLQFFFAESQKISIFAFSNRNKHIF